MLFLQYTMTNLVLTKSSGPKSHAVLLTAPIFAGFCAYYTDLSGGVPAAPAPRRNFSLNRPSLTAVGRFAQKFVGNSAHMP